MPRFRIVHDTHYAFEAQTGFGPWRLMLRPTDSHAMRLEEATVELSPPGETLWSRDAYDNSVCVYQPAGEANALRVVSTLMLERFPAPIDRVDPGSLIPIQYDAADELVLAPFRQPEFGAEESALQSWIAAHAPVVGEPALTYLKRITQAIKAEFGYAARDIEGTQTAQETVTYMTGACRDLAQLMIETVRRFGFAARFASGYLYSRGGGAVGAGATHAWCEVYLPELGWLEFDPTNGIAEAHDLIRIASTRTPEENSPVSGATLTPVASRLNVRVEVTQID